MPWPNFLIIGTSHAGTSSLYFYLQQHPDVFLPHVKEPGFFKYAGQKEPRRTTTTEAYLKLFAGSDAYKRRGEASPFYLYDPGSPGLIHKHIPNVKMIVVLRDPVRRAFSHYIRDYVSDPENYLNEFRRAFADEGDMHYVAKMGFYSGQIERYLPIFDREQFLFLRTEEMARNTAATLRRIAEFLEIDPEFQFGISQRYNVTGLPRNRLFHQLLSYHPVNHALKKMIPHRIIAWATRLRESNLFKPELPCELHRELLSYYRDDIRKAENVTGLELEALWQPAVTAK